MNDLGTYLIEMHREKLLDLLRRSREALEQLGDEDVNWRPNDESNSIANLIVHMAGNLHQRLSCGIGGAPDHRDREAEFDPSVCQTRDQMLKTLEEASRQADEVLRGLTPSRLSEPQRIRNRYVTVLDVIFTVATHMSEHVGQILYIAKLRLGPSYRVLSIPRATRPNSGPQEKPGAMKLQAVFIDRDGTMGGTGHFMHPRDFELFPRSAEAIRVLKAAGIRVFALTNQHRISDGRATEEEFVEQFRVFGLHGAYICPHRSEADCGCHKPAPGLLHKAAKEHDLDLSKCAVIGDVGDTDMMAAAAVGAVKVLVRTGWGESSLGAHRHTWADVEPDYIAVDLLDAAQWLVKTAV